MTQAALGLDRMYAWQTGIYDFTRRPYLLGCDQLIESLAPPNGSRVLEIRWGAGRNLIHAARRWLKANFCGFDVTPVMLTKAREAIGKADLEHSNRVTQADAVNFPTMIIGISDRPPGSGRRFLFHRS